MEYDVQKDQIFTTEHLVANSNNSLYSTNFIDFENQNDNIEKDEYGNYIVREKRIKANSMKYYMTLKDNNLYFVSTPPKNKKEIVAIDSVPKINWNISETESKKINNFTCYKATTVFRGSEIVAYYTPEIPIGFGPFKFKGLPGLILEVYNVDTKGQKYHWKAKKIVYPYQTNIDLLFNLKNHIVPIVSYRSIVENFEKKMTLVSQKVITSSPRGDVTRLGKIERTSIEKKYEWEEE